MESRNENISKKHIKRVYESTLTEKEKKRISYRIQTSLFAFMCLVANYIFIRLFPGQEDISALILFAGAIAGLVPIVAKAAKEFQQNTYAMEQLVTIALIASILDGRYLEAIIIPIILTFVHFLEERSILGGRDAIEGLKTLQAKKAILFTESGEKEVAAKDLKPGDIVIVRPGVVLPVDGTVKSGISSIDQKSLTGESIPKDVTEGDMVFAGTTNLYGLLTVRVEKEIQESSFSKILELLEKAEQSTLPIIRVLDNFFTYYIPFVVIVALAAALVTRDISRAVAVLVSSCPCAYVMVSSTAMIASIASSTKRGILIKSSRFLEELDRINTVIFDKTGTLTEGDIFINGYILREGYSKKDLLESAAKVASGSMHPISKAVVKEAGKKFDDSHLHINEVLGSGLEGRSDDEEILFGKRNWLISKGYEITEDPQNSGPVNWLVKNGEVMGCIKFGDKARKEAKEIIDIIRSFGIERMILLTGDSETAAEEIKNQLGLDLAYHNLLPDDKVEYVKKEKKIGNNVLVIGDGINDAPALAEANVGIAMGAMGSDTAIKSSDIALMSNDLYAIPFIIELSKKTKNIIYENMGVAVFTSIIMITLATIGIVTPIMGAMAHNIGTFAVVLNSSRLLTKNRYQQENGVEANNSEAVTEY